MKQCPNPDCILYTRLEELPDAYVKCPGCGGPLVDSELASGRLSSHLVATSGQAVLPFDEYDATFPQPVTPYAVAGVYPYEEEFADAYPDAEEDPNAYPQPAASGLTRWTRAIYAGGILLLLVACLLFGLFMSSRLLPQSTVLSSPEATEIALSSERPAINTPIAMLPAVPSSVVTDDGQAEAQPFPTIQPSSPSQPAQAPAGAGPAPTAPPIQAQPNGGIIDAHMTVRLEKGRAAGQAQAYKPDDPFNLAVEANFGPSAVSSITVRWYGPDGTQLYQAQQQYSQAGTYYVGFTLKKSTPWAVGDYRADIHANGSPLPDYSVTFSVVP